MNQPITVPRPKPKNVDRIITETEKELTGFRVTT
jgi:hypothetical protein